MLRALEEVLHIVEVAAHPSFALQKMEKGDSSHHLLDVVAYLFLVVAKGLHEFIVRRSDVFFFPFTSAFHESLAGDVLDEVGVLLAVFLEELVGERLDGEGVHEVLKGDAFLLEDGEAFYRGAVEELGRAEDVGVALG